MHPVGPLPPRVYWVRRVIILVVAVVVLLGLVYLVAFRNTEPATSSSTSSSLSSVRPSMTGVLASTSAGSRSSESGSPESSTVESTPPGTTEPSTSEAESSAPSVEAEPSSESAPSEEPAPPAESSPPAESAPATEEPAPPVTSEEPPPPPVRQQDAEGRDLCFDNEITLTALAAGPFAAGTQPVVGIRIQNTGAVTCTRDVSASLQVFTVLGADGSHIWSTADCFPGVGTEVRTLTAGQTLEYQVKWSGTTSQPGCTGDRVRVPAGSYQLVVSMAGVQSAPTPFEITG